jgi:hypothetical protein
VFPLSDRLQQTAITHGPLRNSTNSSLPVNYSDVTNQTHIQQVSPGIQNAPLTDLQEQRQTQQQPFVQEPPPSSQLPFNPIPMNPSGSPSYSIPYFPPLSQPTEIPPRILSDNNYVASTGILHIVDEVINESSSL